MEIFELCKVGTPNPCVVQESAVLTILHTVEKLLELFEFVSNSRIFN